MARGTMRGKIRRLEEALECSFLTCQHAAVLAMMLTTIDHYTTQIEQLTARTETLAEPYLHQIAQLDAVPGIGTICAQAIIAEIGTDMTVFPAASHLVSWARWSPQVKHGCDRQLHAHQRPRLARRPRRRGAAACPAEALLSDQPCCK